MIFSQNVFLRNSLKSLGLASVFLTACSSDPPTFITFAQQRYGSVEKSNYKQVPRLTDALAVNYANGVESIFRARATGARYTREASDAVIAGLSALTAAAGALSWGTTTVTALGLGSSGMAAFTGIFNAKARTNAYSDAAKQIHAAVQQYLLSRGLNSDPQDTDSLIPQNGLTATGWALVLTVQTNIDLVDSVLNGHLPSQNQTEPSTLPGALRSMGINSK
jgi:hypothetical protein